MPGNVPRIRKGGKARTKKATRHPHHQTFMEAIGMMPPRDAKGRFKRRK